MRLDPVVIGLLLMAGLMHATWNALLKSDTGDRLTTFGTIMFVGGVIGLLLAPFLPFPEAAAWPWLIGSLLIHILYYVFLLKAYETGDLSHTYPIARGMGPLLVAAVSGRLLGEHLAWSEVVGVAIVSGGIVALALPQRRRLKAGQVHDPEVRRRHRLATMYAMLTGVTIAAYIIVDGIGVRVSEDPRARISYIVWLFVIDMPWLLLWAFVARPGVAGPHLRRMWWKGAIGGTIACIGYAIAIYAMSLGPMAHVAALRETSVLFGALMGALLLRESFGWRRIAAAAAIVAGLTLMNWPAH
jgi:drug/metabolite transporter (DMT)-like permease